MFMRCRDERGIAMVTALLVSMVLLFLSVAVVALSLHNSTQSALDRSGNGERRAYLPSGALAPPEGLEPASDFDSLVFSSALAPPEGVASPEPLLSVSEELSPPVSPLELDASPEEELGFEVVEVLVVDVVEVAAFSAPVSVGGVMSGVVFGITSPLVVPLPHAPRATPAASTAVAARAARALGRVTRSPGRAGPCAARTWDTR